MAISKTSSSSESARFHILGIPIDVVDTSRVTKLVCNWANESVVKTVFVREVASLMSAVDEPRLAKLHERADLVVPDGTPLVWLGRLRGYGANIGRVAGADLMDAICKQSLTTGQSHFFFGGKPGVVQKMAAELSRRHPGLKVAGMLSPPMREIGADYTFDETARSELDAIKSTSPDFVWVGISSPKQEYWMMNAAPFLGHGVLFGVGAAFDFHSGDVKRAPKWMRRSGLEWAHRLMSEPRRLWRRYLIMVPRFIIAICAEQLGSRRYL